MLEHISCTCIVPMVFSKLLFKSPPDLQHSVSFLKITFPIQKLWYQQQLFITTWPAMLCSVQWKGLQCPQRQQEAWESKPGWVKFYVDTKSYSFSKLLTLTLVPVLLQLANPTRWSLLPSSVLYFNAYTGGFATLTCWTLTGWLWRHPSCAASPSLQGPPSHLWWSDLEQNTHCDIHRYCTCDKLCLKLIGNGHICQG